VQGIDGPAGCQQDRRTFEVMRFGQAISWSLATLESYQADIEAAQAEGRNLIAEKYARMMASTDPQAYAELDHQLPRLTAQVIALIEAVIAILLAWEERLEAAYPNIFKRGRPLHSIADGPGVTSIETYLRGELATYSERTLKHYLRHIRQQNKAGINGAEATLAYMVSQYGFDSLEAANQALGNSTD
jgi:hypothetical protein